MFHWLVILSLFVLIFAQNLKLSTEQIKYLCEEASRAGTQGQRAEIFACEVARASAGELVMVDSLTFLLPTYCDIAVSWTALSSLISRRLNLAARCSVGFLDRNRFSSICGQDGQQLRLNANQVVWDVTISKPFTRLF